MADPNWQPIGMLLSIAALSNEQLANANEQYAVFAKVHDRPHVLTDEIVARVIRLYVEQREQLAVHKEQLGVPLISVPKVPVGFIGNSSACRLYPAVTQSISDRLAKWV
jgi:hypothetical protein